MNTLQKHLLANRSRRIPRRIRQLQAELKSHDQRCACIEDDTSIALETRQAQIKKIRDLCGPLNYQLRMLQDRLNSIPSASRTEKRVAAPWNGVARLTASGNFPEATTGRRVGKCARAYRTLTSCFSRP